MGIVKWLIVKQVKTSAAKGIIRTVGEAAANTVSAASNKKYYRDCNNINAQGITATPMIKLPNIGQYIGKHYLEARAAFINAGFTDISFVEVSDIRKGWFCKDGDVKEISVGGKRDVDEKMKFLSVTPVVIYYHTFSKKTQVAAAKQSQYSGQERATQQVSMTCKTVAEQAQCTTQQNSSDGERKIYCTKCGAALPQHAVFCGYCGHHL